MIPHRRALLLGAGAALTAGSARAEDGLQINGRWVQGGFVFGRTWPGAMVFVDEQALTTASATGLFVIGLDRDAPASTTIEARWGPHTATRTLAVERGVFPSSRIDGLPPSTIEPSDPELLARIRRETAIKVEGFASRDDSDSFRDGFTWPLETWRVTSRWGSRRVLNGTPARPHYGIDLAAPAGSAITAPAEGLVTLAQSALHFEGGLVLIDHGQGLVSAYLHQSRLMVQQGRRVRRGDLIGRVGMTGRATGPHLCWRLRWRDRHLDPSLMVGAQAPEVV